MTDRSFAGETRSLTIAMSDTVFAGVVERGRKSGYTPTLYAKLLFEAGYAARVGKGEADPLLAACVEKSFSRQASVPAPKAAPAPQPAPVVRIIAQPVFVPVVVPVLVPVPVPVETAAARAPEAPRSEPEPVAPQPTRPAPVVVPPPPAAGATSALIRTIKAFAAAGQSPAEIAEATGAPIAVVRQVIKGAIS